MRYLCSKHDNDNFIMKEELTAEMYSEFLENEISHDDLQIMAVCIWGNEPRIIKKRST